MVYLKTYQNDHNWGVEPTNLTNIADECSCKKRKKAQKPDPSIIFKGNDGNNCESQENEIAQKREDGDFLLKFRDFRV